MTDQSQTKQCDKGNAKSDKQSAGVLTIPQPFNLLIDIYGVISSWNFTKELKSYAKTNLSDYLTRKWTEKSVILIVEKIMEQTDIDRSAGIEIPDIRKDHNGNPVIESVVNNILWQINNRHKSSKQQLDSLFSNIWNDAYTTSKLKTHVFKDVKPALEHWRTHLFIKIYTYASGSTDGQKLFFKSTIAGDLSQFIANYINSSGGYKYDSSKFKAVISALRESDPKNLLYLTDDPKKARAAIESGMRSIVVIRPGNEKYSDQDMKGLMTIESFDMLKFKLDHNNPPPCC